MNPNLTRTMLAAALALFMGASALAAGGYAGYYEGLPFKTAVLEAPVIPDRTVSIRDFGGIGNGIALNTEAFAKAIAHLSENGGGHLVVPDGVWLTGPVTLRDNIDLHLEKNALMVFSQDRSLYSLIGPDEGTVSKQITAPINASHARNFSITGSGIIDGNGEVWRPVKRMKVGDWEWNKLQRLGGSLSQDGSIWYPASAEAEKGQKRPRLLRLVACENFLIQGVTFQNSPSFHVNMFLCRNFILDGINVLCPWNAQNGDGIDLSSFRNALLVNCSVNCGDDAICMKSGVGDAGRRRGPTTDIVIDNCTVYHGHGGFVIGSDEAGGMNNLSVRNCRFVDTDTGLRFKSGRDRGGVVENVYVANVVMNDIEGEAILFEMHYGSKVPWTGDIEPQAVTPDTPVFRNFHISGITCSEAGRAILIHGLPEKRISGIHITNCSISAREGIQISEAEGVSISGLTLQVAEGPAVSVNNASDIVVKGLDALGADITPRLTGSRNGSVTVIP